MRELTVDYKWASGKSGSFIHRSFPEPLDMASSCIDRRDFDDPAQADAAAEALAESAVFQNVYWGWFRQVLVTWRADAKRLRDGNKSTPSLSASETALRMERVKLPDYKAPSEAQDPFERGIEAANAARVKSGKPALSPAEIDQLRELYGVTVHTS